MARRLAASTSQEVAVKRQRLTPDREDASMHPASNPFSDATRDGVVRIPESK